MSYRDVLRDFNLYVDGLGYAGRLRSYSPPKVTVVEEDYRAAGMDAPIAIDLGIEKLVAECSLGAYDADIMSRVGQTLIDTISRRTSRQLAEILETTVRRHMPCVHE
jgi:hypothetical protein